MSQQTFNFHGPVTIHIHDGGPTLAVGATAAAASRAETRESALTLERKQSFDPDYDGRPGYDPQFLAVEVPPPSVHTERMKDMLTTFADETLVLNYHHYSLAINKARRFAMWTAANVDYSAEMRGDETRDDFGDEGWRLDERAPARFQVQDGEFYKPARRIDRGHLVRRDDAAWGRTPQERAFANADTYHWTNCTPQHERFNRASSRGAWGLLEIQIKSEAQSAGERVSVFAGPVLADDDPEALGLQYPVQYWKVIVVVEEGSLRAYGFTLDQRAALRQYGLGVGKELDFDAFVEQQTALQDLEALTGVSFPQVLHDADVCAGQPTREIKTAADLRRVKG